jgi:hypothetical protein
MKHLSEEELLAQVYGEGDIVAVKRHLDVCAECSNAYMALEGDLAEMKFAEPPARDAGYGETVWQSLSGSLRAYESGTWIWLRGGLWKGLSFATACALVVASAFIGGRLWERKHSQDTAKFSAQSNQQQVSHISQPERVVVVVLSDHLDRSERLLVELKHADGENTELVSPLRDEARSLLAANRICRKNAKPGDDPELPALLDRLDHLLQQLANQPGGLDGATLTRLQKDMNTDGLLFEVRVLRSRLPAQQKSAAGRTKGGTI